MSSRKSKKNQKLGSSRRNKNRNKDIEENEYDDGFPDPGNEKHDSEHSQFSTASKHQESNEPAQFDSDQPVIASTSKTPSEFSPHPQSYESKNLTGQAEVTSKKRKMGSTRKSNREFKFGEIYEDEPELGGQLCVEVIKEQGETVEVSIKEDSGKEVQKVQSDCAPSAEHESSILQGEDLAYGTTMHNEDDHNNDEHQHLETAIQSKPMDSSSSELNQSKEDEFGQDLIRTSLDFSIFTQTECNVPLQESNESLKICHQMDTFTTDHKSSIDTTTPFNENREEGQDVQMSLNNLIHNDKPSVVEQNVLETMDDQSSLNYRREDVDTLDSCSAEEKNEVTEVALIDEHEHVTQDDKVATHIWPNVSTKASTEDENKDEDQLKKNDDSLNITKESSYKSKSIELREDPDEYKEVSVLEDRNDNVSNKGVATTNLNQAPEPDRNISCPLKLEDQEVGTLSDQFLSNEFKFQAETEIKYYREEQYNVSEANTTSESSADMVDIQCDEKKKYNQTGIEKEVENEDVQSTTSNQLFSKVSSTNMSDFITESELISAERLYVETETSFQTHTLDHNNSGEFPIELESKNRVCSGQMFDNEIKGESLLLNIETEVIKEKNNDINTDATESITNEDFIRVDDEKGGISTFINGHEIISVIANRQDYAFTEQAPMEVKEHGLENPDKGSASPVHAYARKEPVEHVPETQVKSDMQTYNAIVVPEQKQNMSEECPVNATNNADPFENTFSTPTVNESRMGQNDAVVENVRLSHFEKKEIDSTLSSHSGLISDSFKAIDETIAVQSLEESTLISEDATLSFPSETCHHQFSVSMNILKPEKMHENMVNQDENVTKNVAKNENTNTLQEYIETPLHVTTEVVNTDQERNILDRQDEVTVMIKNICRGVDTTHVDEHLVNTEVLKMQRGTDVAESIAQNEEAESLDDPHPNNYSNFKLGQSNPSECTDIGTFTINTDNLMAEPLDAAEDQINTVVLDEVSSVEGLTELLEQNQQPIVNEEKEAESTHLNEQEMGPIITKIQNDDFTEHVSLAVKMQGNESPDDEHDSEANAYTMHSPVELIPQTHTMSDTQMNTEHVQIVGSDQNQNKSEEHPENFTKRESDLEPCQRTSAQQYLLCEKSSISTDLGSSTIEKPSPATEHPDFKEVDKNGIENQGNTDVEMSTQTKKRRKVGSTRRLQGRHQQTKEWKEEWKDLEHTEKIVHQIITQAATSILLTEPQNTISEVSFTYDIHDSPMTIEQKETIKSEVQSEIKVIDTPPATLSPEADQINTVVSHEGNSVEGLSDVKEQNEKPGVSVKENAESTLLNEQEMAPIITNITTINLPTSEVENPDFKEDNVNTTENVENKNTEINKETQTKKKKKYGSTRRPHERKQPQTEGEDEEWKDSENTEENEQQIITQAIFSNLLTEPQNTISEVSVDSNESNVTMEQKEIIKSDTEIRTGEIDTSPAILSPEADQINTVISDDISSVEGLTDEQNEKLGVNEEKDSVSCIANMQKMTPFITKVHDDTFAAVKEHVSESADDEHVSEVKALTPSGQVELIPHTHTMSDKQVNTENIHVIVSDQNLNISEEHLENLTNRESEPVEYESTSPFVQVQELKSSQEKRRKMGSTRQSLRGQIPRSDQKSKLQAITEKENIQKQNMEQKDTHTVVTEEDHNDTKEKVNVGLIENVIKEDITPVSAQQDVLCEVSSLTTDLGFTTIKHPSSAGENLDFKEDNVNTTENVENENAEIHIQTQTKKKKKFGSTRRPHGRQELHAEGEVKEFKDPENTEEIEHQMITQADTSNLLTDPHNTTSEVSCDIHDSTLTTEQKETIETESEIGTGVINTSPAILLPEAEVINTVFLNEGSSVSGVSVKEEAESTLLNEQEMLPIITTIQDHAFTEHVSLPVKLHGNERADNEYASEVRTSSTSGPVKLIPQTHSMSDMQINTENIHAFVSDQNQNISEEHPENSTNKESEPEQCDQKNTFEEIKEKEIIWERNMDKKEANIGVIEEKNNDTKEKINTCLTENIFKEDITPVSAQQNVLCEVSSLTTDLGSTTIEYPSSKGENPDFNGDKANTTENVENKNAENHTQTQTQKKKKFGSTRRPHGRQQPQAEGGEWKDPENTEEIKDQIISQSASSNLLTESQNTINEVLLDIHDVPLTMEQKETIQSEVEIWTVVKDTPPAILSPEADQMNIVVLDQRSSVEGLTDVKEQNEKPGVSVKDDAASTLLKEQEMAQIITKIDDDGFAAVKEHGKQSTDANEVSLCTTCSPVELTVVSDEGSRIEGLSENKEYNEKTGVNEVKDAESTLSSEHEMAQVITKIHDDAFTEHVSLPVKKHGKEGPEDEHAREVNVYSTCDPVEIIFQAHTMSDMQMNTDNIHAVVSDQNQNIPKEHLENLTNREPKPEQYESTIPFVQIQELKSSQVDEIKENVDLFSSEKKRKIGSTRKSLRGQIPGSDQINKFQAIKEIEKLYEQNMDQKDTNTGFIEEANNNTKEGTNAGLTENVGKEDITSVCAQQYVLCEVSSLSTDLASTTIEHPVEHPECKEDDGNSIENVDNTSAEIYIEDHTKKKKKFGSTQRPQRRQQPHAEGEEGQWKDPENTEETVHQIITQADTSNLLTDPHNTTSEITPMITELHDNAFAAVKEHVSESVDDEHASEVNASTTCVPVELIPQTHTMSDLQMNTENIHVIVSDQNLNISEEHLENPTNRESEPEQYESTSPFVQIQEPKSAQVDVIKENVEFSSSEKTRKMGSTRRSLRGPGIEQKSKFQEIKEIENLQEQNMEQKDTNTGVTQEDNNDTKKERNYGLTENVIKEDITPVTAQPDVLCEVSSPTTVLGFTTIEHPSSAGENPDFKEDNVNTTENVENENAEIHTQMQTKKKKKFGSTQRPHGRQTLHAEGEKGEWKDPENAEENEHQMITQADTSNLLTDPQNTTSEVSLDIHDSNLTMEPKETIKSEVEIRTGVIDTKPAILSPEADQINTVVLEDESSVEGLTDVEEQNEKPRDTEDEHAESALLNEQEITPMITELHGDALAAVKEHVTDSYDDEHASEVNAYTTCVPVEIIPQTCTMSDLQMNTENIHVIVSDQNLNISEEHLENPTNRESEPEQYESTSPFVQVQEPKSSQVDVIKENVEFSSSEKKRKMGSTRRSLRGPAIDQKSKFQEIKEIENLQEQNMEQKDTNTGVTQEDSNDTKKERNYGLTENVIKEDITPVSAQPDVLCEVSSLPTDLGFTTIEHPSSAGENPDFKEDNVNTTENVENENAEIHTQMQTKKKKKFGSTRRPHERQTLHAEGEKREWKDPENAEENEHQVITQADTSNLLTDPHNTTSEVSHDIHDSNLTMEAKETIKSEAEIRTGVIDTKPAILSPEADQINTVVLEDVSSVEGLTDFEEQNEKTGYNEDEHAESALLNEQEITPMITELHGDAFAAVKEHVTDSYDDKHVREVNTYTTCVPVEIIPQTRTMSDLQMNTENIHVIVSDQNLNISEEHLENPTNRESEPEQYESTSPFVQIQEPKSSQIDVIKENVEFGSSEKKRKMGSTRRSLRGPGIEQKSKFQEIKEIENLQEQNMEQKDTNTGVTQEGNNDTKEKINADLTENVIKEDITPVSAEQNALCEVSSLTTVLGFTTIEHPSSAGENPDFKEDNVNTTENVENRNAEIHTQMQTKKKKKFGSAWRLHGTQQPQTQGDDKEWKDPENTEIEHQVITQADTSNLLTDPQNTTSEVSRGIHDSNLTMEPKETIKSEVEIGTGKTDTQSAILSPEADQINTVVLEDVSSVEGLTDVKEQNEKPGDNEVEHAESALLNEQEITQMITELHSDAFAAVKEHVTDSHDDKHVREVNAYTTCVPVELIPQTCTMSDLQMNTENIHVIVSDQNLNISEEHLENLTNRELEPEQYESTIPFVQIQELKSSQVDVIKENVEFSSSEKKRKMGSTRRSLRGPGIHQKSKFQEIKEIENLQEQNMEQKDTNTGVTQEDNSDTKKEKNYCLAENVIKEDITPVSAQPDVLCEVSSLPTDLGFTTIEHPSSAGENPDFKENNVNTTENVENENAEIHTQMQTKKKKKFGSTRRPHGRQTLHAEGEKREWKDPENAEENEHQVITQADTSNLLTDPHNTTSEVSHDIHDSNLTMEPKETIKSEVEIRTGVIDTKPAILSPEAVQINTVVLEDESSVEGLTEIKEQNDKPGDNEVEHAESALLNEQEITPIITELHGDALAAVKEHVTDSHDDKHASEVNAYTTCVPVELIPQTCTMSVLQMNTENIHVIVPDQNLNISEEHLENPTNRESEPEQYESTSPFVQIQEPKSSQVDVMKENVEFGSSEKKRKMGSTRRSLRGPAIEQKNKFQEIKEKENLQEQNMEEKDTNTGVTQEDNNDTKEKINADLTENVIKEDITPVSAEQNALCEVSSLTNVLGFTTIEHPSSAGENPYFNEDNVNTTENVENRNAEIHTQSQTKKKKKFGSTRRPQRRQQPQTQGDDEEWKDPENTETEHQVITQAVSLNLLTDPHNTTSEVSRDIHDSTLTMEPKETIKSEVEIRTGKTDTQPAILSPEADQINTVVLDDVSSVEGLTEIKEQNEKPGDTEDEHAESALLNEKEITPMITELHGDAFAALKEHVTDSHDDEHASEVNAYTTCVPVELIPQTCTMSDLQMNTENIHVIVSDQNLNISEEHLKNPTNRESEPEQYESTSPFVQIQEPKSFQVHVIKENVEFNSSEKRRKMGSTRRSLRGPAIEQKSKFQEIKEKENLQEQNMEQKDTNTGVGEEENNDTKEGTNAGLTENVFKEDITPVSAEQNGLCEVSSLTTDLGFTTIRHPSSAGENPDFKEDNVNTTENVENENAEIHTQTQTKKKKKFGSTRRPQRRQQPQAEGEDGEWKDLENAEEIEHHIITQAATSNLLTESQNTISEVSLDIHNSPLTVEQNETIKSEVEIGTGVINTPPAILSPDADQINTVVLENLTNRESESEQNESTSPFVQMLESKSSHVDVIKANVEFSGSEKRRKMGSTRKSLRGQITGSDQKNKFQEIEEKEDIQEQNMDQKDNNTENTKEENNDKKEESNAGLTKNVLEEDFPSVNAQQYVLCEVPSLTTDLGLTTIKHPSSATEHPEFKEVDENSIDYVKNEKAEIQTQIQAKKKKKFGSTRRAQGRLQPHGTEGKLNDMEDTEEMHNSDLNFCDTKTRKQEYEPPIHNTLDQSECSLLSEIELYLNKSFESTLNTSGLNPNISEFSDPISDGSLQLPSSQSSQIHMEQTSPSRRRKMGSSRKMTRNRQAAKVCDESRGSEQEKENLDNNNAKYSEPNSEEKTVIAEGIEDIKQSVELMPEVQALSQLNESSTQATEPLPEVKRKFGSRRKVKGSSHLGAFTNGDNENKTEVTKDKLRVSDPFYMSEQESTQIAHPDSEPRSGIEEVKEAVGKDTNASTEAGLVSLHTIRKTSPGVVSTGGRPKIDFNQWNEQIPDFEQAVYNVMMVGNSNVGKTSFIKRLQNGHFIPDYSATIGVDTFVQTVTFGSRTVKLYVWDTAGQERYHSITKQVFHKAQGLLLMYDITSSQSFQAVRAWISQVQENAPSDVILMLLGNKNDRTDREVQLKEGEDLSKEYDIDFMECSAATGENVLESLKTLAWLLVKQRVRKEEEHTTLQPKPQNKKKSGCC